MRLGRTLFPALVLLILFPQACLAGRSYTWDTPKPVDPNTGFFGETQEPEKALSEKPEPGDKSYPWYYLDKGNKHTLANELEKAEASYREAFSVSGPTRVLSGFKLVETLQRMGRVDTALETLDMMEQKYLVSTREFGEAKRLRTAILDEKRKGGVEKKAGPFTGREWVKQISAWRVKFALEGMDTLRAHGIPLKESYQGYVFLLEEHFLAHPDEDASKPAEVLAALVYERDGSSRIPIDQWRADPDKLPIPEPAGAGERPPKITGAEWITLVHNEKMEYVAGAMEILRNQHVPMKRSLYGYVDALDKLFTEKPELSASDSVVALASFLYGTEPEARQVLEALRLE
jgi:hypothetical protein